MYTPNNATTIQLKNKSSEPRKGTKPSPSFPSTGSDVPFVILLMVCAICGLFLIWRRARSFRSVVGVR